PPQPLRWLPAHHAAPSATVRVLLSRNGQASLQSRLPPSAELKSHAAALLAQRKRDALKTSQIGSTFSLVNGRAAGESIPHGTHKPMIMFGFRAGARLASYEDRPRSDSSFLGAVIFRP